VDLMRNSDQPLSQIARELGVTVTSLRNWKKQFLGGSGGMADGAVGDDGQPGTSAKELWNENQKLRRENAHLKRQREILKKGGQHPSGGSAARHAMINKMREENYSVNELSEAFEVSRSGYYAARKRPPSQRAKENEIIVSKMKEIHSDRHLKAYGCPRMTIELHEEHGLACSENRVARLMANNNLKARYNASIRPRTTVQDTTQK